MSTRCTSLRTVAVRFTGLSWLVSLICWFEPSNRPAAVGVAGEVGARVRIMARVQVPAALAVRVPDLQRGTVIAFGDDDGAAHAAREHCGAGAHQVRTEAPHAVGLLADREGHLARRQ